MTNNVIDRSDITGNAEPSRKEDFRKHSGENLSKRSKYPNDSELNERFALEEFSEGQPEVEGISGDDRKSGKDQDIMP